MKKKKDDRYTIEPRKSIKVKSFFAVMGLTFGIGLVMLVAGIALFLVGTIYTQYLYSWDFANAEASMLENMKADGKIKAILDLYDSIPEEERGDGESEEYKARFEPLMDEEFVQIKDAMHNLKKKENGPLNAYVFAVDKKFDKMINIIDSDPVAETFVYPGSLDYYDKDELQTLVYGAEPIAFQKRLLGDVRPQATITTAIKYGLRVTGASTLFEYGDYIVLVGIDNKMGKLIRITKFFAIQYLLLLVIVTVIAAFIGQLIMQKQLVNPITKISNATRAYGHDTHKDKLTKKHFDALDVERGDEIGTLALTLKDMEKDIRLYADNLTAVTAEKERISTELSVAARIQESVLPSTFPPYPERSEFDIYASMEPAKEVGGDFYDFFLVDDDHVGIVIADVSGKGIPAALFMMASKIQIGSKVEGGFSPAEVLEITNERICNKNHEEMFVTVWLGILEISTGKLTASNAGHEYPVIIDEDGAADIYKDRHGFVIGGMPGMKYTNYEIDLKPGQKIFVYTDGLTEATSEDKELFGMERAVAAAGEAGRGASPREVIEHVNSRVDEFVAEAEQFDDLTMLCLEYRGK